MERVQHYASVDARKCLEPGVAGERYKPVYSVDDGLVSLCFDSLLPSLPEHVISSFFIIFFIILLFFLSVSFKCS